MENNNSYEKRIVAMRKEHNSYILTILQEAINWNPYLDEIVVLCDVLRILDKYNFAVSKNEVRTAFNKYYLKEFHSDKKSYLNWIYREFKIKHKTRTFTSQARKNSPLPQTTGHKNPINSHENQFLVPEHTKTPEEVKQ